MLITSRASYPYNARRFSARFLALCWEYAGLRARAYSWEDSSRRLIRSAYSPSGIRFTTTFSDYDGPPPGT
eukprot:4143424-Pyramimonas_sp.AAC.1